MFVTCYLLLSCLFFFLFFLLLFVFYFLLAYFFFFFFQAEDGIRDRDVTGVQTCALPISSIMPRTLRTVANASSTLSSGQMMVDENFWQLMGGTSAKPRPRMHWRSFRPRSEERRVGKECRSRRSA